MNTNDHTDCWSYLESNNHMYNRSPQLQEIQFLIANLTMKHTARHRVTEA